MQRIGAEFLGILQEVRANPSEIIFDFYIWIIIETRNSYVFE